MKVSCESDHQGSLGRAWKHMSWLYYQYLLVTALYMLEPWERTIFILAAEIADALLNGKQPAVNAAAFPDAAMVGRAALLESLDSMLVSIVGMALYTGYIFMPQHILAILHYFEIVQ